MTSKKRTVFVSGIFNTLHPGHVRLLRFAREIGEALVVAVIPDEWVESDSINDEQSRLDAIRSLRMVDQAFLLQAPIRETLRSLRPAIVVKGREHSEAINEEADVLAEYGGRLVFSSGDTFLSGTALIKGDIEGFSATHIHLPLNFMEQHGIQRRRLLQIVDDISDAHVTVFGDSIVDEYIECNALGMSREDATLVVAPTESRSYIGGAAIVAAHAASIGCGARLHTVVGADDHAEFLRTALDRCSVDAKLHVDESRPTTNKQRWRVGNKTLLRVNHFHQDPISHELQRELLISASEGLDESNVVIFSDFSYGALPQKLLDGLIDLGRSKDMILAADSQSSSQMGDISRFAGMHLVTPTEYEARVATRNFEDGLVILADQLRKQTSAGVVFMTLAEDGVFIRGASDSAQVASTEQLPALNKLPRDVAGAGDALLVVSAMALSVGATIYEAALLGSVASAVQVASVGNRPLERNAIIEVVGS